MTKTQKIKMAVGGPALLALAVCAGIGVGRAEIAGSGPSAAVGFVVPKAILFHDTDWSPWPCGQAVEKFGVVVQSPIASVPPGLTPPLFIKLDPGEVASSTVAVTFARYANPRFSVGQVINVALPPAGCTRPVIVERSDVR